MTARDLTRAFAVHSSVADSWVGASPATAVNRNTRPNRFTKLTIDVTPSLRGRIKVAPFRRGITVAEMLRGPLSRRSPDDARGAA